VVNDEDVDGSVGGLKLKTELAFEGFTEGRGGYRAEEEQNGS
jgi:hypothetical protein